jgi:hypothetical protein
MNQAAVVNEVLLGGPQFGCDLLNVCRIGRAAGFGLTNFGVFFPSDQHLAEFRGELVADVAIRGSFRVLLCLAHVFLNHPTNLPNSKEIGVKGSGDLRGKAGTFPATGSNWPR